jgi:DNA polymerase I
MLLHIQSNCKSMIDAFKAGGDFHSRTAMGMYPHVADACRRGDVLLEWDESKGIAPAPLLKNVFGIERRKAKVLNFSIAYGKTALGLSKDWGVTLQEATDTLERWYRCAAGCGSGGDCDEQRSNALSLFPGLLACFFTRAGFPSARGL